MKAINAALSAFYPVLVLMGAMILARFWPLLKTVAPNTKPLICSMLVIVVGVIWEQIMYGYGRFSGEYISIATTPLMVGIGKVIFMVGFTYLLYAFWLLAPKPPRLWVLFFAAGMAWAVIFAMLLL